MELPELIEGRLVRRYKRFLADIELPGRGTVVCHCANPGSMLNCAPAGGRVWVSTSDNPRRKLAHTWELCEESGALICVNTQRANPVVGEGLRAGVVGELGELREVRSEAKLPSGSRLDFRAESADGPVFIEVKCVTLGMGGGVSAFPDSVTKRGARHMRELVALRRQGARAVLLFCVARSDTETVRLADEIDPAYGSEVRAAAAAGVEVLAYRAELSLERMDLTRRVPVRLSP